MDKTTALSSETLQPKLEIETTLDTRGMEPPSPILAILKRVSDLSSGIGIEVRLDNCPMQLYDLLQQRGYLLEVEREKDGSIHGMVRPKDSASTKQAR